MTTSTSCISLPSFASIFLLSEITGATILFETFLRIMPRHSTVESRKGKRERALMGEVMKLVKLLMTIPATNASSERAFSTLRYIKNYLRTTIFQERLNNLMVTYVYKDRLDLLTWVLLQLRRISWMVVKAEFRCLVLLACNRLNLCLLFGPCCNFTLR